MLWRSPLKLEGTDMRSVRVGLVELGKFRKEEEEEREKKKQQARTQVWESAAAIKGRMCWCAGASGICNITSDASWAHETTLQFFISAFFLFFFCIFVLRITELCLRYQLLSPSSFLSLLWRNSDFCVYSRYSPCSCCDITHAAYGNILRVYSSCHRLSENSLVSLMAKICWCVETSVPPTLLLQMHFICLEQFFFCTL